MSATPSSSGRIALITGGNQGIGYQIVKQYASKNPTVTVLLAARDAARGEEAVKQLALPNVVAVTLDVTSSDSIEQAKKHIEKTYGGLDLLCNNAGVYDQKGNESGDEKIFDLTFAPNYYGALNVTEKFAPLMKKDSRVVNVASQLGLYAMLMMSPAVREKFTTQATISGVDSLVKEYRTSFTAKTTEKDGWPNTAYGVSKAALIVATKILAAGAKNGVTYHTACPGWCATSMTKGTPAPLTSEEGGSRIVYVLELSHEEAVKTNGKFFEERAVSELENKKIPTF